MALAGPAPLDQPFGELNMTPLVDVLLVLLVVLILSVPVATHSLSYDLPGDGPPVTVHETRNRLTVTAQDRILWNGAWVTERELAAVLRRATAMAPEPQLEFAPEGGASYNASARVLQLVKASGATNFGFAGNERHRDFGR